MPPNRFLERMLKIDPSYGSQEHQARFLKSYEARQEKSPCPLDHEHVNDCYYVKGVRDGSFVSCGV